MITTQLLITLGGHALSGILVLLSAIFVIYKNPSSWKSRFFAFLVFSVFLYEFSFVLAPLMPTHELAYTFWFINIVDVFITLASTLFIFSVINKMREYRWFLIATAIAAFSIFFAALLYPLLFLPQVVPKLYFPWYLDGGPLYVLMLVFFIGVHLYSFYHLFRGYLVSRSKEIAYYILMFFIAYTIGPLNFFLVFDYPVDPLYGVASGYSMLFLAYGVLADDILDIRIIAKKALVYSFGIGSTVFAIALLIFLNEQIVNVFPWIQFWTIPVAAGVGAFVIGHLFWRKSTESDRLKYEFVTVATHKLRTPLTQINWGLKTLKEENLSPEAKKVVDHIEHSNIRLIELTNILFESTQENMDGYSYTQDPVDLLALTKNIVPEFQNLIERKNITLNIHSDEPVNLIGDTRRLRSVIEVLLENALAYSSDNSLIQIITYTKNNRAYFSIHDQGIGVASDEQSRIFSRFYRTDAAKRKDTEGVGLGLAMSRNIIISHKGKIGVESPGEGKGSTFWFWVPTGK